MRRVILDTNCLVYAVQHKLDIIDSIEERFAGSEISVEVPTGVMAELGKLASHKGKDAQNAAIAYTMMSGRIKDGKVKQVHSEGHVDAWLVKQAKISKDIVVCTYDSRLKECLKKLGAQILTPRGRKRF